MKVLMLSLAVAGSLFAQEVLVKISVDGREASIKLPLSVVEKLKKDKDAEGFKATLQSYIIHRIMNGDHKMTTQEGAAVIGTRRESGRK